jgi:hypothetical protein
MKRIVWLSLLIIGIAVSQSHATTSSIPGLTELTEAASEDLLVIEDVTVPSTTKKITIANFIKPASVVKTADYTILTTDGYQTIFVTCSSADITITLPAASTKRNIKIAKTDVTAFRVIIARAGSDTIAGNTYAELSSQYQAITLESNGTATWFLF